MKQEKMKLILTPSDEMDRWAKSNPEEHNKIRLSKKARLHYGPSDWEKIYLRVHGEINKKKLRIRQAPKNEIKKHGATNTRNIGFVTTKTYNALMGQSKQKSIWISEELEQIMVGADPEFVLCTETGHPIYADHIFGPFDEKWDKLGSDGPCAELRPDPTSNIDQFVSNIQYLLKNNTNRIKDLSWVGGATYWHESMYRTYPIGGHIHFGLPKINGAALNTELSLQKRIVRILDEFVALPLVRCDGPRADVRRQELKYGAFEDCRTSNVKFEWRVPSGLWLVHPELTRIVIGTAKGIVEECWKRYADRNCDSNFMLSTDKDSDSLINSFQCSSTEEVRSLINGAKPSSVTTERIRILGSKLKKMSTYCIYKDEISDFITFCCSKDVPLSKNKLNLKLGWLADKAL